MDILSLTKETRIYNGLKTITLTSGAGKTGQPLVKADLGDLCSGVVSTELGLCPETHTYRGRQNHMNKSLLSKRALVNLSL